MKWLPLVVLAACARPPEEAAVDAGATCGCARWASARDAGVLPLELGELSGLVASRAQPGVLYAHNDSGDSARFFALSTAGALLQTFTLPGAAANDWEDIALGPCDGGRCVYLGDIGDNLRVRTDYAIYRVPEPSVTAGASDVTWERLPFEYPNGEKHNSEALFMHPVSGTLYLVTKASSGPSVVYRFPSLDPATTVTLERVAELPVPASGDLQLTGADLNACGTAVLLRMYNRLVELRLPEGAADFEAIFSATPVTVPSAEEEQGEAVAYSADGRSYFTGSETIVTPGRLSSFACRE